MALCPIRPSGDLEKLSGAHLQHVCVVPAARPSESGEASCLIQVLHHVSPGCLNVHADVFGGAPHVANLSTDSCPSVATFNNWTYTQLSGTLDWVHSGWGQCKCASSPSYSHPRHGEDGEMETSVMVWASSGGHAFL